MKTSGNTILITGGATGIGFALAESLVKAGNKVIICGRRENKLKEAKLKLPQIETVVCDISKRKDRESLAIMAKETYKSISILINNAGIQRIISLKEGVQDLVVGEDEIKTNLIGLINLSTQFIPLLKNQNEAAIINVSSGLGFVPMAVFPVYCATKAAVHSFTVSMRHQLKDTPIKVFEIIPPMVDTDLGKATTGEEPQGYRGIPAAEVAKATLEALVKNQFEIPVGQANGLVEGSKTDFNKVFQTLNH